MPDWKVLMGYVGTAIATFVGVLGSIAVAYFTFLSADRGHDIRMVEISLSILRGEGDRENSLPARKYALAVLERYSNVSISPDDKDEWAATGITPFSPVSNKINNSLFSDFGIDCNTHNQSERVQCLYRESERLRSFNEAMSELLAKRNQPPN